VAGGAGCGAERVERVGRHAAGERESSSCGPEMGADPAGQAGERRRSETRCPWLYSAVSRVGPVRLSRPLVGRALARLVPGTRAEN